MECGITRIHVVGMNDREVVFFDVFGECFFRFIRNNNIRYVVLLVRTCGKGQHTHLWIGNIDKWHPQGDRSVGVQWPMVMTLMPRRWSAAFYFKEGLIMVGRHMLNDAPKVHDL